MFRRVFLVVAAAGALVALCGSAPALAASPWWNVVVRPEPTVLRQGTARDEVQKLTVTAAEESYTLARIEHEQFSFANVSATATAEQLRLALEGLYGEHNVEVTGGPGDATGSKPYEITFTGELADQPIQPIVSFSGVAHVSQVTQGRPDGKIVLLVNNLGDADAEGNLSPITITDVLPAGLKAVAVEGVHQGLGGKQLKCSLEARSVACTAAEALAPYEGFEVAVSVDAPGPTETGGDEVSVIGGGAPTFSANRPVAVGGAPAPFGVQDYETELEEEGGALDTQAGSHPFQLTTTIMFNQGATPGSPPGLTKDLHFREPVGLIGDPVPFPRCSGAAFVEDAKTAEFPNACPPDTVMGAAIVSIVTKTGNGEVGGKVTVSVPVFNLEPDYGEPARFGFTVFGVPVYLDASIRTGEDYGVTIDVSNIPETATFLGSVVTFWGVPGDERHDDARGWPCIDEGLYQEALHTDGLPTVCAPAGEPVPPPFLTMPTWCGGELQSSVEADSWQDPGMFAAFGTREPMGAVGGCNRLPFTPSLKVTPDGRAGSTPTGLTVDEHVSQSSSLDPGGLAESDVKGLSVTLPEGVSLNPAAADGLQSCSLEQIGLESDEFPACPEASKVATVTVRTPLLPEPLEGAAYLAAQSANPFGSLVAMYIYAENPKEGLRVKAAGEVVENPVTGQLTAHFEQDPVFERDPRYAGDPQAQSLPELAFEDVELHFFGGDRAPLASPAKCGGYVTTGTFTPWSEAGTVAASSEFQIVSGPNGSPCQDPLPFTPTLTAGTTSIQAGGFSPFTMTISREDGQQNISALQLHMPSGLSGVLSGIELCGEAQANAGSCSPNSLIGETTVSVGLGGDPYSVTGGKVYITGPYEGAPFGLSIVVPAKAGPYDLGQVVVRGTIHVDPLTSALTITTDTSGPYAIPHILDGIPLEIKHVNFTTTRSGFTFNPTNCEPSEVTGSVASVEGSSSPVSVPFQVTNCAVLTFKPQFSASTSGHTSRANGASLHVKLAYPKAVFGSQANIKSVRVELPKALPSRLTTLNHACLDSVFNKNPANCPSQSRVGAAKAVTPLIPVPLEGPAYFVSHGGQKFPELIVILQGYGVTVYLQGETFISQTGITSSTFASVPDVPVGNFELTLPEGPFSALAANKTLCATNLTMPTTFHAQNGATLKQSTPIEVEGCPYSLGIVHRSVHKRTLTLTVSVPQAGKLIASGKGVSRAAKSAKGRQNITLTLNERHAGKLNTQVLVRFTPSQGKQRKVLHKSITVTFR